MKFNCIYTKTLIVTVVLKVYEILTLHKRNECGEEF